jgi:6-phosphogluconolactonase
MKVEVFADPESAARAAAEFIAEEAQLAVKIRGLFTLAVSGGHTPWLMLRSLADQTVPWEAVQVVQVDERVAPDGDPDRNLTHLKAALLGHCALPLDHIHAMPVESADLEAAAERYAIELQALAGSPPVLDLVHLGLGPDGHTASLVPWDPVLEVNDADVAVTGEYQGRRRMTLTYPVLNRARRIVWLVTGEEKAGMLVQLVHGDRSIPAGRVGQNQAVIIADEPAAVQLAPHDIASPS